MTKQEMINLYIESMRKYESRYNNSGVKEKQLKRYNKATLEMMLKRRGFVK